MNAPGLTIARLADDIARRTGGRLAATIIGSGERLIRSVAPLDSAAPDQLGFLANKLYRSEAAATRAGAVVL